MPNARSDPFRRAHRSRRVRWCSVAVVFWLLLPSVALGLLAEEKIRGLADASEAERFQAAASLLSDQGRRHPKALLRALDAERTRELLRTAEARAAADFVRRELLGRAPAPPGGGSGVLLISIDTLRADHLGCYGYERDTTPAIDALARGGTLFLDAASTSSWTLPAHMSMLTSLYPSFHKLEKGGRLGSTRLDDSETTLAQRLRAAGYATAGIVAHPFLSAEWGFDRGFDVYLRYTTRAEAQTGRALLWLEWHRHHVAAGLHRPDFFLFLHFIDPHEPYDAPGDAARRFDPDYAGRLRPSDKMVTLFSERPFATPEDFRYAVALYDGEIRYVDSQLARLFAQLDRLGLRDSTLVILTSDHGEEFKDHGSMGHKQTLYEETLHVPLIVSRPPVVAAGRRVAAPVSLLDLAPSVLDLTGQSPLPAAQGVSLKPLLAPGSLRRPPPPGDRILFAELGPLGRKWERDFYRKTVRKGGAKLVVSHGPGRTVRRELYDLANDPGERRNRWDERRDEGAAAALEKELNAFVRRGLAYRPGAADRNRIDIDEKTRERLRALGYME